MERRLLHARRLLKETGILVVAIGDDEHHRLRMLLDQIFGDENFIANVTWQGSGKNDARYTAGGVDYMLIYARNESRLRELDVRWKEAKPGIEDALAAAATAWEQSAHDPAKATAAFREQLRRLRSTLEPAVYRYDQIDEQGRVFQADNMTSPNYRANLIFQVVHPIANRPVPTPSNSWRYSEESMARLIETGARHGWSTRSRARHVLLHRVRGRPRDVECDSTHRCGLGWAGLCEVVAGRPMPLR